jgi:hypothetical protein
MSTDYATILPSGQCIFTRRMEATVLFRAVHLCHTGSRWDDVLPRDALWESPDICLVIAAVIGEVAACRRTYLQ